DEPRLIARYQVPFRRRVFEGKGELLKKNTEILSDVGTKLERLERTNHSPIFLGIQRGVQELRRSGCDNDSDCYLFVRTDGEETAERGIRSALEGNSKPGEAPAVIANEGISIFFCGLAETDDTPGGGREKRPAHNAKHEERIRQVWSSRFRCQCRLRPIV